MAVARVTEISATSPQSFEDAIRQGLERATKTRPLCCRTMPTD
jgi:flavin-binding protein dodecin